MSTYGEIYRKIHWGMNYAPWNYEYMTRAVSDKAYNGIQFDAGLGTGQVSTPASMEINYQLDERKSKTTLRH